MTENHHDCPKCQSENVYPDGNLWVCAECFNEWTPESSAPKNTEEVKKQNPDHLIFTDSNGTTLNNGDTVISIKDLKMGKETIKSGTKFKNIRLLDDSVDGHDVSCKAPGYGSIYLKCSVVKKTK